MAKSSMIAREAKRTKTVAKYAKKREELKAIIKNPDGVILATGLAYEKEGSTFINKTSYIENCETSAWGRALGNLGIGIDTSIASAEEVGNAIKQQNKPKQVASGVEHSSELQELKNG